MNNTIRYLLKGMGFFLIITFIPALIIVTLIIMISSAFQTEVWANTLILPRWIGVTFLTTIFIGMCILIGKISELNALEKEGEKE